MKRVTRADYTNELKRMAKKYNLSTIPINRMVDRLVEFWGDKHPIDKTPERLIRLLFQNDLWEEFLATFSKVG